MTFAPRHRVSWLAIGLAVGLQGVAFGAGAVEDASEVEESCVRCHRDPDFLVTNPKLYNYYRDWERSIHRQEDVSCSDCHGGRPEASGREEAHAGMLGEWEATSAVNFANVPTTCGSCHGDVEDAYRQSAHFEHLAKRGKQKQKQGPSCVTCHSSMNTLTLDVTTVEATCSRCHNRESDNHPEIPDEARRALNRFLSIDRFRRYVVVRLAPQESRLFLEGIESRREDLSVLWHTFDLEQIEVMTGGILDALREKRNEIRAATRAGGAEQKGSATAGPSETLKR